MGIPILVLAVAGLIALGAQAQRSPFATGSQSLSFLAFALAALYVLLERTRRVASHGGGFKDTQPENAAALVDAVRAFEPVKELRTS